jgi:hypothetical protein
LVDAEQEEETKDVTISESATMAATETGTESEIGALATNDYSDPAQLH